MENIKDDVENVVNKIVGLLDSDEASYHTDDNFRIIVTHTSSNTKIYCKLLGKPGLGLYYDDYQKSYISFESDYNNAIQIRPEKGYLILDAIQRQRQRNQSKQIKNFLKL